MKERRRRSQSGQAIGIVGAMLLALTILGTMACDCGLSMSYPRDMQAYAPSERLAVASALASTPGAEYIGAAYAVAAVSGDANINGGGAAFQTVGGPVYAYGSFGANNGPHSTGVPSVQTNYDTHPCVPSIPNQLDNGGGPNGLNYNTTDGGTLATRTGIPWNDTYSNASPTTAGPVYLSAAAALDGSGNWMAGIYNGFAPSGGTMNGGVYKIINSPSLALGNITNTVHATSGTSNGANAVAIVIDSSDTRGPYITPTRLNRHADIY